MTQLGGPRQIYNIDTLGVDTSQQNPLGSVGYDINGWEYVYSQGTTSVTQGTWVVLDENFSSTLLQADEVGMVAIAPTAIVVGEFGWFQRTGIVQANTDDIAADASLYVDGTAGRVDDLSVSGDLVIGAYSMTAAVSNKATCQITYPHVSNDLGGAAGGISGPASSTDNNIARWNGTAGDTIQDSVVSISDTGVVAGGAVWQGTAVAVAFGGTGGATAADARTNLGLVIGTDVQAFDNGLDAVAGLGTADANFIVGDGATWVVESGATVRTSLGLAIGTNVQAWDNDLDDLAALAHSASAVIISNGTDWLSRSTAEAHGDIGLSIGSQVQAWDNDLDDLAALTHSGSAMIVSDGADWTSRGTTEVVNDLDVRVFRSIAVAGQNTVVADAHSDTLTLAAGSNVTLTTNDTTDTITIASTGGAAAASTATVQALVFGYNSYVRTGDGQFFIHADSRLHNAHLAKAHARVVNKIHTGAGVVVDVVNTGQSGTAAAGTAMLSTLINIDSGESRSDTSATAVVISTTGSAVLENDLIRIDVDGAGSTGSAQGLIVTLEFVV